MNRTLRMLAVIALACLGLFFLLSQVPFYSGTQIATSSDGGALVLPVLPALLVNLVGQTIFAFCLGVGVAALVACVQRRQWRWVVGLVALLLVAANGSYLILELAPLLGGRFLVYSFAPFVALVPEALPPLAVIAYTLSPLGDFPGQFSPSPSATENVV